MENKQPQLTLLPAPIDLDRGALIMTIGTMPIQALCLVVAQLRSVDVFAPLAQEDSRIALERLAEIATDLYEVKKRELLGQ